MQTVFMQIQREKITQRVPVYQSTQAELLRQRRMRSMSHV